MQMNMGQAGLTLVKHDEALRLQTYDDATGKTIHVGDRCIGTLSIGYGHTGPELKPGDIITEAQADQLLAQDLAKTISLVNAMLRPSLVNVNQNQFDALVCFGYNVGCGPKGLGGSTLLRKVYARDMAGAAKEFARWNMSKGKVMAGLIKRRDDEKNLFMKAA